MLTHPRIACAMAALSVFCLVVATNPQVEQLTSPNWGERIQAHQKILEQRTETITGLLGILERVDLDRSWGGTKERCITLLGELRASEAVFKLADELLFVPEGDRYYHEVLPREFDHVAAVALRNIGGSAVVARMMGTVLSLKSDLAEAEWQLAAWVIMECEGKEQAVFRFKSLAENDAHATRKARGKAAMEYVLAWKPVLR